MPGTSSREPVERPAGGAARPRAEDAPATSDAALVTGASRGIGRASALAFARRGLRVGLVGRKRDALVAVAREALEAGAAAASVFECDVAVEADVRSMAEAALRELGPPRVVVNNAGIVRRGESVETTRASDWDEVIAVNLRGAFLVSRAFVGPMRQAGRGRFVHVASISSTLGSPGAASYAASKWGLVGLSKSLAEELRGTGCESLAVLPGSVDTDMLKGSAFEPRMSPDDVAGLVVYLGLDAPAAMTSSAVEMFG